MLNSNNTGITLMAYSRPDHVREVLEGIRASGIDKFTVFIDGADDHNIRSKQSEIRNVLERVDWAEVTVNHRKVNLGLRISIISAISEQMQKYDQVILLEDDCVPLPGFFDYMFESLKTYKENKSIRSICGYQFPSISTSSDNITGLCVSRFVPWGWATWWDRWQDYDTSLTKLVELIHKQGIFSSLPADIQTYLTSENALNGKNDIWSINWVLAHYLTSTYVVFPSKTLIANIGFDGTGVHCMETKSFDLKIDESIPATVSIDLQSNIPFDNLKDRQLIEYMERHWCQTMEPQPVTFHGNLNAWQIGSVVRSAIDTTPIFDFHTHLFPEQLPGFALSGPDELMTYHYLMAETLCVSGISPKTIYSRNKTDQAEFVWDTLFRNRTPVSEATQGILTILNRLNIKSGPRRYNEIRNEMLSALPSNNSIFDFAKVDKITMTNDPFNLDEWSLFEDNEWDKSRYLAALRLDPLFFERDLAYSTLSKKGFLKSNEKISSSSILEFLDSISETSNPLYAAISVDGDQLKYLINDPLFVEALLPWLRSKKMSLALMIGVKRGVNPTFGLGGDGLGGMGLGDLEILLRSNPDINFLVTHLHDEAQHHLTVLGRKFSNLKLFGFWWFMNQPSLIENRLNLRFDLLGFNFIPQHSDARVAEQLIFKWDHFKSILHDVLTQRYRKLTDKGWPIDQETIQRDVRSLLYDNAAYPFHVTDRHGCQEVAG